MPRRAGSTRSRRADVGGGVRCRTPTATRACRSPPVSTDGSDPRSPRLPCRAPSRPSRGATTSTPRSTAILAAADAGLEPADGARSSSRTRTGPASSSPRRSGSTTPTRAALAADVDGPGPPVRGGRGRAGSRRSIARRPRPTGGRSSGAYLPLLVVERRRRGAARRRSGSAGRRRTTLDAAEREAARRRSPRWPRSRSTGRGSPRPPRSAPTGSSGWPTPIR